MTSTLSSRDTVEQEPKGSPWDRLRRLSKKLTSPQRSQQQQPQHHEERDGDAHRMSVFSLQSHSSGESGNAVLENASFGSASPPLGGQVVAPAAASMVERVVLGKKGSRAKNPLLAALVAARDSMLMVTGSGKSEPSSPAKPQLHQVGDEGDVPIQTTTSVTMEPLDGTPASPHLVPKKGLPFGAGSGAKKRGNGNGSGTFLATSTATTSVDISLQPISMTSEDVRELARNKSYKLKSQVSLRDLSRIASDLKGSGTKLNKTSSNGSVTPQPSMLTTPPPLPLVTQTPPPAPVSIGFRGDAFSSARGHQHRGGATKASPRLVSFATRDGDHGNDDGTAVSAIATSQPGSPGSPALDAADFRLPSIRDFELRVGRGGGERFLSISEVSTVGGGDADPPHFPHSHGPGQKAKGGVISLLAVPPAAGHFGPLMTSMLSQSAEEGRSGAPTSDMGATRSRGAHPSKAAEAFHAYLDEKAGGGVGGGTSLPAITVGGKSRYGGFFSDEDLVDHDEDQAAGAAAAPSVPISQALRLGKLPGLRPPPQNAPKASPGSPGIPNSHLGRWLAERGRSNDHDDGGGSGAFDRDVVDDAENPYRDETVMPMLQALPDARSIVLRYDNARKADDKKIAAIKHLLTHPAILSEYESKGKKSATTDAGTHGSGGALRKGRSNASLGTSPSSSPRTTRDAGAPSSEASSVAAAMRSMRTDDRDFDTRFESMVALRMRRRHLADPFGKSETKGSDGASEADGRNGEVNVDAVVSAVERLAKDEASHLEALKLRRNASGRTLDKSRKMKDLLHTKPPSGAGAKAAGATTASGDDDSARLRDIDAKLRRMQKQRGDNRATAGGTRTPPLSSGSPPPGASATEASSVAPNSAGAELNRVGTATSSFDDASPRAARRPTLAPLPSREASPSPTSARRKSSAGVATPKALARSNVAEVHDTFDASTFKREYDSPYKVASRKRGKSRGTMQFSMPRRIVRRYKLQNIFRFQKPEDAPAVEEGPPTLTCEARVWPPGILRTLINQFHRVDELHTGQVHLDDIFAFTEFFGWAPPPRKELTFPIREQRSGIVNLITYLWLMQPHLTVEALEQSIFDEGLQPAVDRKFWTEACDDPPDALPQMYGVYVQLRGDDLRGVTIKYFHRHFRASLPEEDIVRLFETFDRDHDDHLSFFELASSLWAGYSSRPFPASEVLSSEGNSGAACESPTAGQVAGAGAKGRNSHRGRELRVR